jgi:hypothetical protein
MSCAFAYRANLGFAFSTDNFERAFWIYLLSSWDEVATSGVGTKDASFPWSAKLCDTFHEKALLITV